VHILVGSHFDGRRRVFGHVTSGGVTSGTRGAS
jgi:hypothetical protein